MSSHEGSTPKSPYKVMVLLVLLGWGAVGFGYYDRRYGITSPFFQAKGVETERPCEKSMQEKRGPLVEVYEDSEFMKGLGRCTGDPTSTTASEQFYENGLLLWKDGNPWIVYMVMLKKPFLYDVRWYRDDAPTGKARQEKEQIGQFEVRGGFLFVSREYEVGRVLGLPQYAMREGFPVDIQTFEHGLIISKVSQGNGLLCPEHRCVAYAFTEVGKQEEKTGKYEARVHNLH